MERAEQLALANNMVKLLAYVDDPNGVVSDAMADPVTRAQATRKAPLAAAQADANEQTR